MSQEVTELVRKYVIAARERYPSAFDVHSSLHPLKRLGVWLEKRFSRRESVDLPVDVIADGNQVSCKLTDVSKGGFGLTGNFGTQPIRYVVLQLGDGTQVLGEVRWQTKHRVGARLLRLS